MYFNLPDTNRIECSLPLFVSEKIEVLQWLPGRNHHDFKVFWPLHSLHLETWIIVKVEKLKVMEVEEAEKIVLLTSARLI